MDRKLGRLALISLFLTLPLTPRAIGEDSRWIRMTEPRPDGGGLFVDKHRIDLDWPHVHYWQKNISPSRYSLSHATIDCKNFVFRITELILYDEKGRVKKTSTLDLPWQKIPPDSAVESLASITCQRAKQVFFNEELSHDPQ